MDAEGGGRLGAHGGPLKVAVIGAGWAGLAAAVRATQAGHAVTIFEMAGMPGGRARSDDDSDAATDNGQHILLGGYARTLALMREVGVDMAQVLRRVPLAVTHADGTGFALPASGPRPLAAARALWNARGFDAADKLCLVALSLAWQARRFRCAPALTVAELLRRIPTARVRERLLEPLCVAALNTLPAEASAEVFLAVMRDSLFGARDASDLLLPCRPLAQLLPLPALAWLRAHGAAVHLRTRVGALERADAGWRLVAAGGVAEASFDAVILATPAPEAARLMGALAPDWSAVAAALRHEPIVTLVLSAPPCPWPAPMLALPGDAATAPAQFAFKLGDPAAGHDRVTLVASAAGRWLERGNDALAAAAIAQYRRTFGLADDADIRLVSLRAERRATFRCTAGLVRPSRAILPGLQAAADYVAGPYPATLETAVRAGEAAAQALGA